MAKPPLGERWRYCDRCDFRHPLSRLRKDKKTGLYFCTTQVVCVDAPNRDDELQKARPRQGLTFQ